MRTTRAISRFPAAAAAAAAAAMLLGSCSHDGADGTQQSGPQLPPLQLRPMLGELKKLAAVTPVPDAQAQKELRDLGDVALQLVEADARTAARIERSLLEHPESWWVLEPALAHERVEVRRRAAWLAGRSGRPELQLPLLLRLKYEQDPEAVVWVADALARLGNDLGLAWLDAAIPAEATAQAAGAAAVEALRARKVELPEQPSWDEVRRGLQSFAPKWQTTGLPSLPDAPTLDQAHFDARCAAQLMTTESTLLRPIDDAKFVLVRAGRLPVPLLARVLVASEPYLRSAALELLARIGPPARDAGPAVLPLLADPLTSSYAVRTLGDIGCVDALPYLRPLLGHVDTELRKASAEALGVLRDEPSRAGLRTRLRDAGEALDVRVSAAFGLRCYGDDAEAEAFLAERELKKDYHEPTLRLLRDRLTTLPR